MYLQRGPPIAENNINPPRIERIEHISLCLSVLVNNGRSLKIKGLVLKMHHTNEDHTANAKRSCVTFATRGIPDKESSAEGAVVLGALLQ